MNKDWVFECSVSWNMITKFLYNACGGRRWRKVPSGLLVEPWSRVQGAKPLRNFGFLKYGGQVNSSRKREPSKLIYFECMFDINMFWYALKQNFKEIECKNVIRGLSFLCRLPDIKTAWIIPCQVTELENFTS